MLSLMGVLKESKERTEATLKDVSTLSKPDRIKEGDLDRSDGSREASMEPGGVGRGSKELITRLQTL
jgi:hypothetical protein